MKKVMKSYVIITLGIIVVAIAMHFFLIPNDIAAGGVSGLAMIVNSYFSFLDIGLLMLIMNIILFIIAFILLGSSFGIKTIYASLGMSGAIWALEHIYPMQVPLTKDVLLAAFIGTMLSGLGMGMIFNENASTGGTDIIAKIMNRYIHMDIGKSLLASDFIITIMASYTFGVEKGLYALIVVILNGFIIDYSIEGFNIAMQVFIMSSKYDIIAEYIMNELERGVTLFSGEGGFTNKEMKIIYSVISRKEFIKIRDYIKEVDPKAFISVSNAHEVLGEGFKRIDAE
ncbi:YitT family protein [Oxobacter pfennigii]|nr:YitT family protein [Oxobacter pfennigii]